MAAMEIERPAAEKVADNGHDWSAEVRARKNAGLSLDLARAREPGRGREANTPEQIPPRGWSDILWRVFWSISKDRILSTSGGVAFFLLLAVFPRDRCGCIAVWAVRGRQHDRQTLVPTLRCCARRSSSADRRTLIFRQGNEVLGAAFTVGLLIALVSANSGMAALFDALNVVYNEREKRGLVCFYATTFLFTLAGIVVVIFAITGVVVLPVMLKFVGLATTTEWLLAVLRWPLLFATIVLSLACIYRYALALGYMGKHRGCFLWMGTSMLFSWYVATFDTYNKIYGSLGAGVG